jgi:type IV pilus assembly protein PilE
MRKQFGFTLMEMMITIVILGVLVGVAFPAYKGQMSATRRGVAAGCITEYAQFMERNYSTNMTYATTNGVALALPATNCSKDLTGYYTFDLVKDASTYTLKAIPAGTQTGDSCGTLTVNQLGERTANGQSDTATISKCW